MIRYLNQSTESVCHVGCVVPGRMIVKDILVAQAISNKACVYVVFGHQQKIDVAGRDCISNPLLQATRNGQGVSDEHGRAFEDLQII